VWARSFQAGEDAPIPAAAVVKTCGVTDPETFLAAHFLSRPEAHQAAESRWPWLDLTHPDLPVVGTSRGVVIWLVTDADPALPDAWRWEQARRLAEPFATIRAAKIVVVHGDEHECVLG
jgi:hypothetical protein